MEDFKRRSFLKTLGALPLLYSVGCAKNSEASPAEPPTPKSPRQPASDISANRNFQIGYLSIVQGPTSDTEALFNIFTPRLKKYSYVISDARGNTYYVQPYSTVTGPGFYNVDKLKATSLSLRMQYTLKVYDGQTVVDERTFKTLDIHKTNPNFALISCMADDYRFNAIIDPMWERVQNEKPDFLVLTGDIVYVDSFEFVERKKATEADLWQRYVDSMKRLPLYHWKNLVPIFSTWDDHDYGTNDGDRDFIAKDAALKLFRALFSGDELPGVWSQGPYGVSSVLSAFGQNFYFMDDRTFRQPNKNQIAPETYGQWGENQHDWLLQNFSSNQRPSWIINGNQCFNGKDLSFKESFEGNAPSEFNLFTEELKKIKCPVVFASGDIHFSEVMRIPANRLGYETYEFTSSAMHSYADGGWDNPLRVDGAYCEEFNFFMIHSQNINGSLQIDMKCVGMDPGAYFANAFNIQAPV